MTMDKKSLSERDICTKFITPALRKSGWDEMYQIREEVSFTKGRDSNLITTVTAHHRLLDALLHEALEPTGATLESAE